MLGNAEPGQGRPADAWQAACCVLAPYVGPMALRRFRWLAQEHVLAPQPGEAGLHARDGLVRHLPWQLVGADAASAELRLAHRADAHWPFAFELSQQIVLTPEALTLRLTLINTDEVSHQPVGLGFHPRFARRSHSRLHIEISDRWETDATGLPTRRQAQPGIDAEVAWLDYHHDVEGWRGPAAIRDEKLRLALTSSLPYLRVEAAPAEPTFCVAPVSQVGNAIHMADPAAHGLRKLAPGEAFEAWMTLHVAPV